MIIKFNICITFFLAGTNNVDEWCKFNYPRYHHLKNVPEITKRIDADKVKKNVLSIDLNIGHSGM